MHPPICVLGKAKMFLAFGSKGDSSHVENAIKALSTISELHIISRMPRELSGGSSVEQFFGTKSAAFHYSPSARSNIHAKVRRRVRAWLGQNSVDADVDWILSYYRKHSWTSSGVTAEKSHPSSSFTG
jgi:hypothetical protein